MRIIQKYSILLFFTAVLIFCCQSTVSADDNEIFGAVQETVEPNILLIIDNSGSMTSTMEVEDCWQECVDWECPGTWECQEEVCKFWVPFVGCLYYECVNWECCVDGSCGPENLVCSEYEEHCEYETTTRMAVAKQTVKDIIDQYSEGNRFGVMTFHENYDPNDNYNKEYNNGGYIPYYNGKYATCSVKDTFILDENGEKLTGSQYDTAIENYKTYLKNVVDSLVADGSTPLKETLAEAGRYFAEQDSLYNKDSSHYPTSGTYPDQSVKDYNPNIAHPPIGYRCRKNYIVLMTDGIPQLDNDSALKNENYLNDQKLPASNDYPATSDFYYYYYFDSHPELQDVAGFLYDNDINAYFDQGDFKQYITTYTIGFSEGVSETAQKLLQDTADRGLGMDNTPYQDDGGLFFYATGEKELAQAFETIMFNISEQDTMFSAPIVPVSQFNRAYAGDYGYMAMFKPQSGQSRWIGNLKKYYYNEDQEFASCDNHEAILHPNGQFKDTATSCWTNMDDGGAVNKGGAGQILSETSDDARNIYSNITDNSDLTSPENEFSKDETSGLTPSDFGFATESAKDTLIDNIRMVGEQWKLGDLNHSKPAIASYGSGGSLSRYIFVGSNDGMLHCFDDTDGTEEWAFIPSEQFSRLEEAYTGDHSYFMDGSPTTANTENKKMVICGERRGGNNYYALDISSISSPDYMYTYATDGQSWQKPQFLEVAAGGSSSQEVFLLTGGYDKNYDTEDNPSGPVGNSVIMISAEDGTEYARFDDSDLSAMAHSIVSAFATDMVDDGKSLASQMYAGDLGGNMFAFRDNNNPDNSKALDGSWQKMHLFSAVSTGKKIFEEADFVPEYIKYYDTESETWKTVVGDYAFFGTGDRANPLRTDTTNYIYCVKNDWHTENITVNKTVGDFTTLNNPDIDLEDSEKVMIDVTENKIQDGTPEEQQAVKEKLNKKYNRGWYIELEGNGEKLLSSPVVFGGVVYFTTFTPDEGTGVNEDPCVSPSGGGTAKLYAIDYKTGAAVYNSFDETTEVLGKSDRAKEIAVETVTIAPDTPIIITVKGEKIAIGPSTEDVKSKSGAHIFYWKQYSN